MAGGLQPRLGATKKVTGGGVVPDAGGARLLAVCPAGANDRAAFDAILTAADVLDAFG